MAILQVHQSKALKQVHEGSTDPGLMQELRTGRRCPPWWFKSAISGSTWQRWRTSTRHAFLTPPSPRRGCSATPSRALPSSSRRYSSRSRRSSTSCPGMMHIHRCPQGQASVCPSPWVPSCVLQICSTQGWIHYQMHPAPGLVCSDRLEGCLLSCFDPSATQTVPTVCVRRTGMAVQGPPLSLSPRVFTKVVEGARTTLWEVGVRILNYLDDWLILAQSREQLGNHRDLVLRHLSQLGLRVNWEKSKLSPVQRISFLGVELDSVSMTARLTEERAQAVLNCLSSFRSRNVVPLKQFQRLLGHMASAAAVTPLGLLQMRPLQHWLHSRVPRWEWRRGTLWVGITQQCCRSLSPWTDLAFLRAGVPLEQVSRHTVVTTDASSAG